ncbi:tripartite tricarboxylate transporter substrate-binding protein [Variovorax sp. CF079]|uniref:tripartite tricarboxylate transporter substrate-binding protein n=1 Tax=Variovorax sp. CF079 TaxID=1882774 RepID=UPI000B811CDA
MTDVVGGQVPVIFDALGPAITFVKAGKVRALAVTSAKRSPSLPDVLPSHSVFRLNRCDELQPASGNLRPKSFPGSSSRAREPLPHAPAPFRSSCAGDGCTPQSH